MNDEISSSLCSRRRFAGSMATTIVGGALGVSAAKAAPKDTVYRAAVIGHTGRGNYGHGMENLWRDIDRAQLVAVADASEKALAATAKRLGVPGFGDYRIMLQKAKPDLVSIGPRWLDQHRDMVVACANAGVKGIYLEKPMCRDLAEADEMVAACLKNDTRLAIATQTRYSPQAKIITELIRDGVLGDIVEYRARGKDDHRGGGEDLWVLGTHVLDLMRHFGGDAETCYAQVLRAGRPVSSADVTEGNEGIGPLAGDEIHALYRLASGAVGYWDSKKNAKGSPSRFGIRILGTKGVVELYDTGSLPFTRYLPSSSWSTGRSGKQWLPITSNGIDKPETVERGSLHSGNVLAVNDLIDALSEQRQPVANIYEARKTVEMIAAVFESHRVGRAVTLPLKNRKNPLTMLR